MTATNKLIVIFNGPPDSGKDHAAKHFSKLFNAPHFEMKAALRAAAHKLTEITLRSLPDYLSEPSHFVAANAVHICNAMEYNKSLKSTMKQSVWGDRTWREFLIHISEDIMKPIFGQDVFGRAARKLVRESDSPVCFFSDGGFQEEIEELRKEGTVLVFQLEREGCEWGGDSRGYIQGDWTYRIHNGEGRGWLDVIQLWVERHAIASDLELPEVVHEDQT